MRRKISILHALLLMVLGVFAQANAQFIQQGSKLTGTGMFGYSVDLSADGNTALIGAPEDSGGLGAAWVYVRVNEMWSQQAKLVGTGAMGKAAQGSAVALSGDGKTAIVGGTGDDGSLGAAWVFTRSGSVWSQEAKLVGTGAVGGYRQGNSVDLSVDGNTAIVGAEKGCQAWVFTRTGGAWRQQGTPLVGTYPNEFQWSCDYGNSVSLAGHGNTALVGGAAYLSPGNYLELAWVLQRRSGKWYQQGSLLLNPGGFWGDSVLSADGNTALLSGGRDDDAANAATPYIRTDKGWMQQGDSSWPAYSVLLGKSFTDDFGSVALSANGNTALIGGVWWAEVGVFTRMQGAWHEQSSRLLPDGLFLSNSDGVRVALSSDGRTALLGSPYQIDGAAWVFVIPPSGPSPGWTRVLVPVGVPGGVTRDGADRDLKAVAYGSFQADGDMFAIGGQGGNVVTYDGIKVISRPGFAAAFEAVAFSDNGVAVALADKGWIYRSADGVQWTGQQKNNNRFTGVAYGGGGVFVAVQAGGHIFRSSDSGTTWQESVNLGQPWTTSDLTSVAYGNGTFVVGVKGSQILLSKDLGFTWKTRASGDWPNDLYWTAPETDLEGIAFGHGKFVAAGANGAVFVSDDNGEKWTWTFVDPAGSSLPLHGVAYGASGGQEYFVAVGKNGLTLTGSVDPITGAIAWTKSSFPTSFLRGVAFGMGRFVAVGYGASIIRSKPLPW